MTIQLSVTIWTILCFAALYWILRKLLFEPVPEVMDQRNAKLRQAKNAKLEAERQAMDARQHALAEQEAARLEARRIADEEAEALRLEGKRLLEEAKRERITTVEAYRTRMEQEYAQDMEMAEAPLREIADRFLAHLLVMEP